MAVEKGGGGAVVGRHDAPLGSVVVAQCGAMMAWRQLVAWAPQHGGGAREWASGSGDKEEGEERQMARRAPWPAGPLACRRACVRRFLLFSR